MRRFEEGLAFYIRNQLTGQPILTYQELYEQAVEVELVKTELTALNANNQKRKGFERGTPGESVNHNQKKPTTAPHKSRPTGSTAPRVKCSRTNHTTSECQVGTKKCIWWESPKHLNDARPRRINVVDKGAAKPLAPPYQGL